MTGRWRKKLLKVADVFVSMSFDEHVWAKHNLNHSYLQSFFPLYLSTLELKNAKFVRECEGSLQRIWTNNFLLGGNILRKLFSILRSLEGISRDMVWEVL